MTTATLDQTAQQYSPGKYVVLYDLDATSVGGEIYRFTPSSELPLVWRGQTYMPYDVDTDGWEWNGRGTLPTPRIRVANVNRVFSAVVGSFGDLLGCTVTRWRTFDRFLDGQPDADPDAHFPVDVYRVERKTRHDKHQIEWELAAAMDQEGRTLPGRLVLRDTCTHRYRAWSGGAFLYERVTCPYAGDAVFTATDLPATAPSQDACSKTVRGCKLRFGDNAILPIRAFPGTAKTRA